MGLKLRMGLAVTGLALSSMFGVNMLAGVKDYVDTTGNIMVDIADGIGMMSKGIEALEYWLDPDSAGKSSTETSSVSSSSEDSVPQTEPVPDPNGPKVYCQKGKCYPYDPARMKNSNVNLEIKPGMIVTPVDTPTTTSQKYHHKQNRKRKHENEKAEKEDDEINNRNIQGVPK